MNENKKSNPPYSLKIGLYIRKWRELKGIKQEQLATQLGPDGRGRAGRGGGAGRGGPGARRGAARAGCDL